MRPNEARRPPHRRIPGWIWLLAAVIFIPAQIYWVKHYWFDRPAEHTRTARYPELASANPLVCSGIRKAWEKNSREILPDRNSTPVERLLERHMEHGPRALLKVMLERATGPNGSSFRTPVSSDRDRQGLAFWLRRHSPAELDRVLLRIVEDDDLHYHMRVKAVIALCRPESAARTESLARIALDPDQPPDLRSDIVLRLPRMQAPLLKHLRPLLYQPFHGLDQDAAIAVALAGEPEAPSILLDAVHDSWADMAMHGTLLADACLELTEPDPEVRAKAVRVRRLHAASGDSEGQEAVREGLTESLRRWLAAHPEARATRFERERAAYLNSDARRRELAIRRFEDILETGDKNLDLGAAAIWCAQPEATPEARYWRLRNLEYLHRLSLLLAEDIRDLNQPEAIIGAMCRRLFPQGQRGTSRSWGGDRPSTLQIVLRNQEGSCVGFSLLLLAMGERLGLPLHGVRSPEHLFVRWDDGQTRRNIETTARGKALTDADYHTRGPTTRPITPEDVAAGRFLVNLTRKQVIASLLTNLAPIYLSSPNLRDGPWRYERARVCADRAVRLDPGFANAYFNRAAAAVRIDGFDHAAIVRDLDTATRLDQHSVRAHVMAGTLRIRLARFRKALHHFDRALAADPDALEARIGQAWCLVAMNRLEEAQSRVESLHSDHRDDYQVCFLRLTLLARVRDPGWRDAYRELIASDQEFAATVRLRIASLFLHPFADVETEPKETLAILDRIPDHGLADGDDEGSVPQTGGDQTLRFVTRKSLHAIQRERDQLRAQAEAMLAARTAPEEHR